MTDPTPIRGLEAVISLSEHTHGIPVPATLITRRTTIPGLFDVETPDGRCIDDLTVGQVQALAARYGWLIR